ncbi:phage tail tape measure protein [Bifidobacterium sp. 82T24]|uniref:phage tail tape measure protein n=1 Tax=Bifidobacterium pluvialisilvae TaxID=2834436 RepID=UPI001C56FD23|nr:phage tail tape measure protein [Bifidobacterium pluvialisilvae]MBW3088832.1 phage tail tape measure protein [Bifidobacterium pluvialisilvae]
MALNENIMIRLMADTSNYTAKMQAASAQASKLGTAMEKPMTTSEKVGAGFTKAGLAIGAVSAAIGVAAVSAFAQFDAAMSTVQANTGASAQQMQQLRQAALDAGANTVYSASEAADAINELGKAGMSTGDILAGGLTGALNLAASDGMAVGEAAELMSSTLAQFNLTGADASRVADALAAGAGKAQGSARDLGYALQQSGMVANSFGISMEETTGTLAAFANSGMIGSDAGTSLKTMLISLANPSTKAKNLMQELGINAYDAQGNFVGLANLAGQLQDRMGGLSQEQRNQALATIFGSDAIRAANVLYAEGADGINQWTSEVSESGFAAEQAAAKNNNLKGDLENLAGSFETMLITVGEGANGPLRSMVQTVDMLVDAFTNLPSGVQQGVVVMGAAVGAATLLHTSFGKLATSGSRFGQAMGMVVDPIQRFQAAGSSFSYGMQAIGAAFGSTERQMQTFGTTVSRTQGVTTGLKSMAGGVIDLMGGPWGIAFTVAGAALMNWANKAQKAKQSADEIKTAMETTGDVSSTMVDQMQNMDFGFLDRMASHAKNLPELLEQTGISMETMARAAQGNDQAMSTLNNKMQELSESTLPYQNQQGLMLKKSLDQLSNAYQEGTKSADDAKNAKDALAGSDSAQAGAANDAAAANQANADGLSGSASSAQEAADAQTILADSFGASTGGISDQANALGEAVSALQTYYGFAISSSDAQIALQESYSKASTAIKENGRTLDLTTEAGRNNQSALNDVASSALKAAEAQARNGESLQNIYGTVDTARDKFIQFAQQMGMSAEQAAEQADKYGLTRSEVERLAKSVQSVPDEKTTKITVTDDASKAFDGLKLKIEATPDGKNVTISGDNTGAMEAIAAVTGATIDPKTGTLSLDKEQYDIALAMANGARIDPKTGVLLGDNSPMLAKVAQANNWKINKKTGVISGNNGPFFAAKAAVDAARIGGKSTTLSAIDNASKTIELVRGMHIPDKTFNIIARSNMSDLNGAASGTGRMGTFATGGIVRGPGTATSDSVPTLLSNGEYVVRAAAVRKYGRHMLDAINWQRYAEGGLVRNVQPAPRAYAVPAATGRGTSNADVVDAIRALQDSLGPIIADWTPTTGKRQRRRDIMEALRQ